MVAYCHLGFDLVLMKEMRLLQPKSLFLFYLPLYSNFLPFIPPSLLEAVPIMTMCVVPPAMWLRFTPRLWVQE